MFGIKQKSRVIVSVNEHEEAEALRDVKHLEDLKGKFEGAKQIIHMARKEVRRIYVNRLAIQANLEHRVNYPTVIINDGKEEHHCHGVIMYGPASLSFDPKNQQGSVSMETNAKIVAFVYEESSAPYNKNGCQ